jgi:hypothetical protein
MQCLSSYIIFCEGKYEFSQEEQELLLLYSEIYYSLRCYVLLVKCAMIDIANLVGKESQLHYE